ncbi:MAG: hypothetical protein IPL84_05600 [Chitinophagaceae bacterium]|nr:hypothetical protein [Chitinophagaceae bacterium]
MDLYLSDWIGSAGVAILLLAFLLNLLKKITVNGLLYIFMNIIGAGLACLASWMIDYIPFVVLEATWMVVSLFALAGYYRKNIS